MLPKHVQGWDAIGFFQHVWEMLPLPFIAGVRAENFPLWVKAGTHVPASAMFACGSFGVIGEYEGQIQDNALSASCFPRQDLDGERYTRPPIQ